MDETKEKTSSNEDDQETSSSLDQPLRVIIILGIAWFFIFSAFGVIEMIQSSLGDHMELRLLTFALLHLMKAFGSLFGPVVFKRFTAKRALVAGFLCHTLFLAANFYPRWYTIVPTGILVGFASAFIWISFSLYVTVCAVQRAEMTGQTRAAVLSKFNAGMILMYSLSYSIGCLVTMAIMPFLHVSRGDSPNSTSIALANVTEDCRQNISVSTEMDSPRCGPAFCLIEMNVEANQTCLNTPNHEISAINATPLLIALVALNFLGVSVSIFCLDDLPHTEIVSQMSLNTRLIHQFTSLFHWQHLLLAPVISVLYYGQPLVNSTISAAYITCTYGIEYLGLVMAVFGLFQAVSTTTLSLVGHLVSRHLLFLLSAIIWLAAMVPAFAWNSLPQVNDNQVWLYLLCFCVCVAQGLLLIYIPGKESLLQYHTFFINIFLTMQFLLCESSMKIYILAANCVLFFVLSNFMLNFW